VAWSTKQLATLAGVTLRTVRWYHEAGLLDEPERAANGYKQYRIAHLVRVLRIKRLTDLGLTPARIRTVGSGPPANAFELLDRELAATIERLQAVRAELALVADGSASVDLPAGFSTTRRDLTDADRSLILLYSRVFDDEFMAQLRRAVDRERTDAERDFDDLRPDAAESVRADVAARYGAHVAGLAAELPALADARPHLLDASGAGTALIDRAIDELYNPAQLDVLARIR
jgi:DNA-binding transcriptional MerR regulator